MATTQQQPVVLQRLRRGLLAAVTIAAMSLGSLLGGVPAAAQPAGQDSWVSVPPNPVANVYRFTVPTSAVLAATGIGTPSGMVVAVEGNFGPGKTWTNYNMGASGGNWTATMGPLEPGLYYYRYSARPAWNQDAIGFRNPGSAQAVTSNPTWNTFFVPGPGAEWLTDVPAGGQLETVTYQSTVSDSERSSLVWTPPGYDENRAQPYPVLYLLQDDGQSYREWAELGRLKQILDNLALGGDIEPMVVVMGDGNTENARAEVLDNVIPSAEAAFNISHAPADRAIAGIGRGASQALELLLSDTGEFSKVGSFSGELSGDVSAAEAAHINAATDLIRLYVGNVTDPAYNSTVALADKLSAAGVEYQSDGSDPATGGTWDTWQKSLHDFASRLFRSSEDTGPSAGHLPLVQHSLPAPGTTPTPWIDENGVVTFETGTEFGGANNVTVWGNFGPAGSWPRTPMEKQEDGRWRLTMPVAGGSYYYKFVVEGQDRKDTANPTSVLSEPNWSTFTVAGDTQRGNFTTPVAPESRGEVSIMGYTSTAGNQARSAYVWTPPGYDASRADAYPVFYLQHGGGQTWTDWIQVGFIAEILDNHLQQGTIRPMVVVMANGNGVNFPNEITQRIAPTAEAQFNVSSEGERRALAGLSAGSGHTLSTLWAHPGQFGYIGAMSAFGNPPASADVPAINAGTKLLRIYTGDIQDFTYQNTLSLVAALESRGIDHEFAPVIPGPHSWDVWQKAVIDFLPRLFHSAPEFVVGGESTSVDEGEALAFAVEATDADGDALTYTVSELPTGASFDAESRQLTWSPDYTQAGEYTITFTATDGYNLSGTKSVTITVRDVTADEQISGLKTAVAELGVSKGLKHALTGKLDRASAFLAEDRTADAVRALSTFIEQVKSLRGEGKLTAEQSASLISAAEETIRNISS